MRAGLEAFFLRQWQQRRSLWQILLLPLSWLFTLVSIVRIVLFKTGALHTHKARVPVIVVGNISVGGTGKTPVVLALTKHLSQQRKPGIVTRGYQLEGGTNATPGDEAILLAARTGVPVVANAKRAAAVETLLAQHGEVNVVVSDDGLQHYALARDIEIAVVDGARGFGNGYLLPAGPLRESVSRLQLMDCIVLNNTNIDGGFEAKMPEDGRQMDVFKNAARGGGAQEREFSPPVFVMTYGNEIFFPVNDQPHTNHPQSPAVTQHPQTLTTFLPHTQTKRIAAIAGIGNPERFFTHLERLGVTLNSRHAFPDHHAFTPSDFANIQADIILMTEKDAVKCAAFADARMWQMQIDAILPDAFYTFIDEKLNHVTRSQAA